MGACISRGADSAAASPDVWSDTEDAGGEERKIRVFPVRNAGFVHNQPAGAGAYREHNHIMSAVTNLHEYAAPTHNACQADMDGNLSITATPAVPGDEHLHTCDSSYVAMGLAAGSDALNAEAHHRVRFGEFQSSGKGSSIPSTSHAPHAGTVLVLPNMKLMVAQRDGCCQATLAAAPLDSDADVRTQPRTVTEQYDVSVGVGEEVSARCASASASGSSIYYYEPQMQLHGYGMPVDSSTSVIYPSAHEAGQQRSANGSPRHGECFRVSPAAGGRNSLTGIVLHGISHPGSTQRSSSEGDASVDGSTQAGTAAANPGRDSASAKVSSHQMAVREASHGTAPRGRLKRM